jgi:TPR repeat protein
MPKKMRLVVNIADGDGGAQAVEGLQEEAGTGRAVQRRRKGVVGDAACVEVLRANAEAQAQAIRGMEQARALICATCAAAESAEAVFQEGLQLYWEQRFSEAAERWGRAALQQHAPSHAHLSDMLVDGRPGVARDVNRAFELASAGASLGCAHSKGALGRFYLWGLGVAADEARGLALGRESEAAGSCFGQHVVGECYDNGYGGVARDYAEAARLYRLAADQGKADSQFILGVMFEYGEGVVQDDAEAVRLYRLSAAQGHAYAQSNLGTMFMNGRGIAQDQADWEAMRWARLPARSARVAASARSLFK